MPDLTADLTALGWDDLRAEALAAAGTRATRPGRVARVDPGLVTVLTAEGAVRAPAPGEVVATGDWVLVDQVGDEAAVVDVLPRRSAFVRGDSVDGEAVREQVVAANVDVVLLVHALPGGPNVRRLERELVLAYESGATPVVVVNKIDLADRSAVEQGCDAAAGVASGVDVVATSAVTGEGVETLRGYAAGNRTLAFVGASGVGKSSLTNHLVGSDVQRTTAVRASDQRGRHTTAARQLVALPGGGVVVDTPGLRAVALWDADDGFARAFADIESLGAACRFRDCSHEAEPGCAVRAAVERGELDLARLDNYRRLDAELDAASRAGARARRRG